MKSQKENYAQNLRQRQISQVFIILGLFVLGISTTLTLLKREPFHTWYFLFAWWSYILLIDGWIFRRRGESLLISHPHRFIFFSLWSVFMWLLFEAFNFRIQNWHYLSLPISQYARWAGYFFGFATVIPALMETADLVQTAGFFKERRIKAIGWKKNVEPFFFILGILTISLPIVFPKYCFPLIWCAFFFLFEPMNQYWGAPSVLSDWRDGKIKRVFFLISAGILCGFLWEGFNFLAKAHWSYTLPFFEKWKLFEMPLIGYLGYPIFALSAFSITSFVINLWEKNSWFLRFIFLVGLVGFCYFMFGNIDQYTVKTFQ